jgi:hypothetical protein
VREFEAKREAYYKDQYRSHVGYWQALGDTMRQSGDNTARLTGTLTVLLFSSTHTCSFLCLLLVVLLVHYSVFLFCTSHKSPCSTVCGQFALHTHINGSTLCESLTLLHSLCIMKSHV